MTTSLQSIKSDLRRIKQSRKTNRYVIIYENDNQRPTIKKGDIVIWFEGGKNDYD